MCAHCPDDVRTRGQECPGAASLALSTLRLTTLAKTQGGASQRPSALAGPMFVCCCVGQAKVNGGTVYFSPFTLACPTQQHTNKGPATIVERSAATVPQLKT